MAFPMQHSDLSADERSALLAEFQHRIAEPEDGAAAASMLDRPEANLASEPQTDAGAPITDYVNQALYGSPAQAAAAAANAEKRQESVSPQPPPRETLHPLLIPRANGCVAKMSIRSGPHGLFAQSILHGPVLILEQQADWCSPEQPKYRSRYKYLAMPMAAGNQEICSRLLHQDLAGNPATLHRQTVCITLSSMILLPSHGSESCSRVKMHDGQGPAASPSVLMVGACQACEKVHSLISHMLLTIPACHGLILPGLNVFRPLCRRQPSPYSQV